MAPPLAPPLAPPWLAALAAAGGGLSTVWLPLICTMHFAPRSFSVVLHSQLACLAAARWRRCAAAAELTTRTSTVERAHPHDHLDVAHGGGVLLLLPPPPPPLRGASRAAAGASAVLPLMLECRGASGRSWEASRAGTRGPGGFGGRSGESVGGDVGDVTGGGAAGGGLLWCSGAEALECLGGRRPVSGCDPGMPRRKGPALSPPSSAPACASTCRPPAARSPAGSRVCRRPRWVRVNTACVP